MSYYGSYLWRLRQKVGTDLLLVPGASVLVINPQGKVLLTKRSDANVWCMPGGAAEEGGSFLQTAIDELREEVGICVTADKLIPFACISEAEVHVLTYPNGDRTHCFAMWFAVENWGGEALVCDEVSEVQFFDIDYVPINTLKPTLRALELYKHYKVTGKFQAA